MENNQMLRELNACVTLCNICYQACLYDKNVSELRRCIELSRDCADICAMAAAFFARSSPGIIPILKHCIELCEECAEECKKHENEQCQKCGHVCTTCAEICKGYINWYYKMYL